jgi:hypothetical protein
MRFMKIFADGLDRRKPLRMPPQPQLPGPGKKAGDRILLRCYSLFQAV